MRDSGMIFMDNEEKTNDDEKKQTWSYKLIAIVSNDTFFKPIMFPHETQSMRQIRFKAARKNELASKIIKEYHLHQQTDDNNDSKERNY